MDMESSVGLMGEDMLASGPMENNMVRAYILVVREKLLKVSGTEAKERYEHEIKYMPFISLNIFKSFIVK